MPRKNLACGSAPPGDFFDYEGAETKGFMVEVGMGAADELLQGWPKQSPKVIYLEPDWRQQVPLSAERVRGGAGPEGGSFLGQQRVNPSGRPRTSERVSICGWD